MKSRPQERPVPGACRSACRQRLRRPPDESDFYGEAAPELGALVG